MWKVKAEVVPVVVEALGHVVLKLGKRFQMQISIQKSALLGTYIRTSKFSGLFRRSMTEDNLYNLLRLKRIIYNVFLMAKKFV